MNIFKDYIEVIKLKKHLKILGNTYQYGIRCDIDEELLILKKHISNKKYKGIIIYPEAIKWDFFQRPQHMLREFAKAGYLCLFIEHNIDEKNILSKKYENLYVVNDACKLLPLLVDVDVIFYITYYLQYEFAKVFKNKIIWLDIVDKIEFFALYNSLSLKKWNYLIENADIATYSASELSKYFNNRSDCILLENAVNKNDFNISDRSYDDIKNLLNDKKIIGYFGAIEEWFDYDLLKKIDDLGIYNIIIIGNVSDMEKFDNFNNVYCLGFKKYDELVDYAKHFDISIIPFLVNDLTNSVSPVKFFEYMALNLPVITTEITEMVKYESKIVKIINDESDLKSVIDDLLKIDKLELNNLCEKIVENNLWDKRAKVILNKIEEVNYGYK